MWCCSLSITRLSAWLSRFKSDNVFCKCNVLIAVPGRPCGEPSIEELEERPSGFATMNFGGEGVDLEDREDRRGVVAFVAALGFLFLRLTVTVSRIKKSRCVFAIASCSVDGSLFDKDNVVLTLKTRLFHVMRAFSCHACRSIERSFVTIGYAVRAEIVCGRVCVPGLSRGSDSRGSRGVGGPR